jgi:hypothetical protein
MRLPRRLPSRLAVLTALFVLVSAGYTVAQRRGSIAGGGRYAPAEFPDGDFVICRLHYPEGRRFAGGYLTDHPLGERNLSIRFSELTRTRVSRRPDGSPNHYLVRLSDDQLFNCPFLMAGDVGSMELDDADAQRLREYLLKGGFLWTDDMWGEEQWEVWQEQIARVLPPGEYPIEELTPSDPIFRSQVFVKELPQIPNYPYWRGSGGDTSEQGELSRVPHFHVIRDSHGRILVAMTRNTDIADAFEREAENPEYFRLFGPPGYALGINVLLYALTH